VADHGAAYPHVIASTSIDLANAASRGRFRADLYRHLGAVVLRVPPLRERREDIPVLASRFSMRSAEKHAKRIQGIAPLALQRLCEHGWPGNVRELENVIERAVILCRGVTLSEEDLPEPLLIAPPGSEVRIPIGTSMEEAQSILIRATLDFTGGNKERAARLLGIASRTIHRRVGPNRPRRQSPAGIVAAPD
jgi:DNA-binding NtrC family response regulator